MSSPEPNRTAEREGSERPYVVGPAEHAILCEQGWLPPSEVVALRKVVEAARRVAESPAGRRYGFLPLINALEELDAGVPS